MNNVEWLTLFYKTTNCKFDLTKRKSNKIFKFPKPEPIYSIESKKKTFKVGINKENL